MRQKEQGGQKRQKGIKGIGIKIYILIDSQSKRERETVRLRSILFLAISFSFIFSNGNNFSQRMFKIMDTGQDSFINFKVVLLKSLCPSAVF